MAETSVNIVVQVPAHTPQGSSIYLTGESSELCDWKTRCLKMTELAPHVYRARVGTVQNLQFKITRGDWSTEAADSWGVKLSNLEITPGKENIFSVVNWVDSGALGLTGQAQMITGFKSYELGNTRAIRIWLPPGYEESGQNYPVIYMHDGQNLFDPQSATFGVDWSIDETMTRMRGEAIVIGIDSTTDRAQEYDFTRRGHLYARFLIDSVKPWVDANFRTLTDRANTFTMGSSWGAVISISLAWKHPDVFSKAAAVSLPAHAREGALYQIIGNQRPALPIQIYMDHGTHNGDESYPAPAKRFYSHLRDMGFTDTHLIYREFPYAGHTEADWARRAEIPLSFLLNR